MKGNGTLLNYKSYEPYGSTMLDTFSLTRQGYIGKEKDVESSLGDHDVIKHTKIKFRLDTSILF